MPTQKKSSKKVKSSKKSLKTTKKLSLKVIIPVILAVSLFGGLLVYVSQAASINTFTRYASEMTGGYKNRLFNNKTRSATSPIYSLISFKEAVASKSVCVHYGVEVESPVNGRGFKVELLDSYGQPTEISKTFSINGRKKGYTDNACLSLSNKTYEFRDAGTVKISMVGRGGILVDKVFGQK